jgi:probable HAF family extracellular repeat protein
LWEPDGRLRSLRSFGGLPLMNALGINNKTEIVGEADSGDLDGRAFLWRQGKLTDLNSFLPPDSGWQLNGAHAINDAGEIVGYGVHDGGSHAFLMVPIVKAK